MSLTVTAVLGSFTFLGTDAVEPGSDTGWMLDPSTLESRDLGADFDYILDMSRGSHRRSFTVWLLPDRFAALFLLIRTAQSFTDWEGTTRNCYVKNVKRQSGSRPFLIKATVDLVEQP